MGSVDANNAVENVCRTVTNDSFSFYSKFAFKACSTDCNEVQLAKTEIALLNFSSTLDVLRLTHERTGHLNERAII